MLLVFSLKLLHFRGNTITRMLWLVPASLSAAVRLPDTYL